MAMTLNRKISHWRGQVVWISGASSGIGLALAEQLLARGAQVILSARNCASLNAICAKYPLAMMINCDITDIQALTQTVQTIIAKYQRIDLFVANAGVYNEMHAFDFNAEAAQQMLDINVSGTINSVAAVIPQLLQQGSGGIAVVASVAGYGGLPAALIYGASKAALINFTETLYLDLSAKGLSVTLITPGFVDTRLTQKNKFSMPALLTSEQAAAKIITGFARGDFEIHFPHRFTLWLKLLKLLPYQVYFFLVKRFTK
ncbi:MAG: SDR family NAD(P)-dependent oxidoreductase [Gallionella sp.]|nr:SDR family NAD(P)-dependent oxidoreductase [Gallionella sp.]